VSDGLPHRTSQEEYWWKLREKGRGIENERERSRRRVIRGVIEFIRGQLSNLLKRKEENVTGVNPQVKLLILYLI